MSSSRDFDFGDFDGGWLPEGRFPRCEAGGGSDAGLPFSYLFVVFGAASGRDGTGPLDSGVVGGGVSLDAGNARETSEDTSRASA
jgi:hypothetical protein